MPTTTSFMGISCPHRPGAPRFPARLNSAAHAGWSSGCRLFRQDTMRPPPGAMPLQNFSASALHSSRTLSAFSARAFEVSRHAGESSASCAFMHFAIAPCPGLTSPQNFLTSAAQGPSLRCWAPASAATPAAKTANAIVTNTFLIDMVPPGSCTALSDRLLLQPDLGRARAALHHPEIALHPVGPDLVGVRPVAAAREHAVLVVCVVELRVVREEHGRAGSGGLPGHGPLRDDVGLEIPDSRVGTGVEEIEGRAARARNVHALAAVEHGKSVGDRSRRMAGGQPHGHGLAAER